ncbi:MAG: hypothetical protein QM790_08990 [Nibricoccus sp.]
MLQLSSFVQQFLRITHGVMSIWFVALASVSLWQAELRAEDAENAKAWRSVTRFRGTLMVDYQASIDEPDFGDHTIDRWREYVNISFTMAVVRPNELPPELPPGIPKEMIALYKANMPAMEATPQLTFLANSARASGYVDYVGDGTSDANRGHSTNHGEFNGPPDGLDAFNLMIDFETGKWQLASPGFMKDSYSVVSVSQSNRPGYSGTRVWQDNRIQSAVFDGELSEKPSTIVKDLAIDTSSPDRPSRKSGQIGRLILHPEFDDVEVEITIEDYAKWRPLGLLSNPKKPGNNIVARATLLPKGGRVEDLPAVKEARFRLLDTSREPGVCMNWPLSANDRDPDMRLSAADFTGTLSDEDQKFTTPQTRLDEKKRPFAEAKIDSYDFGGKCGLMVTFLLADGREIVGVMKGEGGGEDIVRVPKTNGADWIAEAWRKEHDVVNVSSSDDEEKVEGQASNGDGFTLYEEYRGWSVNGQRVEGDPTKKDFFVQNLIGPDANNGIRLFEALSQLRVHSKLRRSEMSETKRLMNGNHREGPHRVDQHGVWVKVFSKSALGDDGASTVMLKSGVAGRPGLVKGIGILARNDAQSVFNKPYNLALSDTAMAFDRAIAHELFHSVGVEHHGSGDYRQILGFVSPKNPFNKLGKPYYGPSMDKPVELLDEKGTDIAARDYEGYRKLREMYDGFMRERYIAEGKEFLAKRQGYDIPIKTPEQYADMMIEVLAIFCLMHIDGAVGVEHGEHSGQERCLLRYYFARFYEMKSGKKGYYMVTPGTERIGLELCRDGKGTGVNAPGFKPQSRYGDAASGAGDCFSQICPNDAIPPRKTQ